MSSQLAQGWLVGVPADGHWKPTQQAGALPPREPITSLACWLGAIAPLFASHARDRSGDCRNWRNRMLHVHHGERRPPPFNFKKLSMALTN